MIYLGADHGGYHLKEKIKTWLNEWGFDYKDLGNTSFDKDDDYPQFAVRVGQKVGNLDDRSKFWKERAKGVLACRSAAGVVIAANKVKGVRAAACFDEKSAGHAREHNDANVIALSGDWLDEEQAKKILHRFLTTEFSKEERHERRLNQIIQYEK